MARSDLKAAQSLDGLVFFDRGLIDAAVGLAHSGGRRMEETLGKTREYRQRVFVIPPWRELFAEDAERRHDFASAVQEHSRLVRALDTLGYQRKEVPKMSVEDRADFVLRECEAPGYGEPVRSA